MLLSQPKGVLSLASTEMWERFSFYTMQALLVLYAGASLSKGGLGWSPKDALMITGLYGAAVYATPVLGGVIGDKFLGPKKSVALGGILMCLGQFILAIQTETAFFIALILLCIGCGFLKPCISAMVGECYKTGDHRRESGFALFYMAINIGAWFGPILGGLISERYGYSMAFIMAGFGLIVGLFNFFWASRKSLKHVGNLTVHKTKKDAAPPLTKIEKQRMFVFMGLCVSNILWNVVYGLSYGLLIFYAENNINRNILGWEIPPTWFYGMYIFYVVAFSPLLGMLYNYLAKKNIPFTLTQKLAAGYFTVALGCAVFLPTVMQISQDPKAHVNSTGMILFYIIFALSELLTVPILLSAATHLSPVRYNSRMVSFNIVVSWSIGAWIAGLVSSWTVGVGATTLFMTLIVSCSIFGLIHLIANRKIEKLCKTVHN